MEPHDILLVDDDAADARIFERALGEASSRARTYWVATGDEAVQFLHQRGRFQKTGPVKIVVLDLHLPGQGGLETLKQIKSDPNLSLTPIIVLSTSDWQSEIDLAYSLGANASNGLIASYSVKSASARRGSKLLTGLLTQP